jgi:hypothetical protein
MIHLILTRGVFIIVSAIAFWVTEPMATARQTEPVVVPGFDELIEDITSGDFLDKEIAAAWLVEYPDRVCDFVEPLSRLFIQNDDSLQRIAKQVFRHFGHDAVSALEPMFHPEANQTAADNAKWRQVCGAIDAIGEPARSTFESRLLDVLDTSTDVNVRVPAIYALTGMDNGCPEAIARILVDLQHENFNVSLTVCRLIIETGPAAAAAVPDLKKLFADGNLSQRTYAIWALAAIGPSEEYDPLNDIRPLLGKYTLVERERALKSIGLLGSHAAEFEPKVREIMGTPHSNLEAMAAFVLWQITGDATDVVPRLVELAQTNEFEFSALEYLEQMGPDAVTATGFLLERTKSDDFSLRAKAVDALSSINPQSPDVTQRLNELATDAHPVVRLSVKMAVSHP